MSPETTLITLISRLPPLHCNNPKNPLSLTQKNKRERERRSQNLPFLLQSSNLHPHLSIGSFSIVLSLDKDSNLLGFFSFFLPVGKGGSFRGGEGLERSASMSSRRAGSGRGGEAGLEAIPESVRRTIQSIRETTGKQHSDEDILTVFEACSMDADETAQRLLYLDTFHEVKRKPRKETFSTQDRGSKGFWGNSFDGFGGRNPGPRRATGSNHRMKNSNALITGNRSPNIAINGPSSLPEANPSLEFNMPLPANGDMKDGSAADGKKTTPPKLLPVATSSSTNIWSYSAVIQAKQVRLTSNFNAHPVSEFGLGSPASDPVLPQSVRTHHAAESASKSDVMSQGKPASVGVNTCMAEDYRSKPTEQDQSICRTAKPGKEDTAEEIPLAVGKNDSSLSSSLPNQNGFLSAKTPCLDALAMEEMVIPLNDSDSPASPSPSPVTTMKNGHVIFPNRFKVPREVKSGLIFGNFEAKSKQETNFGNVHGTNTEPKSAIDSAATSDEIAGEVSNEKVAAVQIDQPASCDDGHELESLSHGESNIVPVVDPKHDQPKQETGLVLEGHQASLVQVTPSYNYNIMPQLGHHLEGHGIQAQDTSLVSAVVSESPAPASASSTPPAQISLATSPQPVLFRPPYHPSYFPYGPYFHPYFFPPMHHPFMSHNGLPQPQATTNPYLTSAPNAAGIKFSIPHMKSGAGAGNPAPTGLPPMYYGSAPVGYNSGQTVTSGSSLSNGDSSASQSKETHIYATGPLSEVPSWFTPTGQEISGMHLNSLYHLQAQGHHLAFPPAQAGHGPFAGLYHPDQTIAAPSTGNQLPQQSKAVSSSATESGGLPSDTYQQPQLAPHNWNSSY